MPAAQSFTQTFPETQKNPFQPEWNAPPMSSAPEPRFDGGAAIGSEQERVFTRLLEQFLESVQSGNDDRVSLMSEVIEQCNKVIMAADAPDEYGQFCKLLVEFLKYISDNQFLDDVRVMNIVSNIQDPFMQWARSDPGNRYGLLDQSIDILRDFRAMFE
jgi:hypothetical protein